VKVNLGLSAPNSKDWERIMAQDYASAPETPDWKCVEAMMAIGDMAEPLGYDGIWAPDHCGTPYGMVPNPLQLLTYYAGRTERVTFGTMVVVAPWWHPIRLAHQIAFLDTLCNGRYETIGLGRGVAKGEFEAIGVPREESRQRFNETLDILNLAFTQERFSYEGEIFRVPETSIRPAPKSQDLLSRIYGSAATRESLEILSRKGIRPLFVGNKPLSKACDDVRAVNQFRAEEGFAPCQPKNVLFLYCVANKSELDKADQWIFEANRDVNLHYGFADPSNFIGVKGYEAYADRQGAATAILEAAVTGKDAKEVARPSGYHEDNLMIGTPDEVFRRIEAAQKACSFSEITVVPNFGTMTLEECQRSIRLFAEEVLPEVQKMAAPIHPAVLPEGVVA